MHPDIVLTYLRSKGITVRLASGAHDGSVTVFLQSTLSQVERAEEELRKLPECASIRRFGYGIVRVYDARHGYHPRPGNRTSNPARARTDDPGEGGGGE